MRRGCSRVCGRGTRTSRRVDSGGSDVLAGWTFERATEWVERVGLMLVL